MSRPLRHGAFVPQGWKLEYSGLGAAEAWARTVEIAQQAESLGYDHIWVYDHFETVPRREPTHMFEAFTTLSALSQLTERVELGQLVTCAGYRNIGLLAKEAACVDVFSGGRFILGIGAGWYDREYRAYGIDYPPNRDRLALLREACEVIPRLWSEETVSYSGEFFEFDGAYCDPKPLRSPRPPILIGGGGEKVTLRIEAEHADLTNWQVGPDEFAHKSQVLEGYCDEIGRDFAEITRTHGNDCRIFQTESDFRAWMDGPEGGHLSDKVDKDTYERSNLVGTVATVTEKAQAFVDAGCKEFINWYRDYPSDDSLVAWIEHVAPNLRPT